MGTVRALCLSSKRGEQKKEVSSAYFQEDWGIVGDAHGGKWHRQVSLLSAEKVDEFNRQGANVLPGAFGENMLVEGIDFARLSVGTRLKCGEVLLEITQIGKECHNRCQIYKNMGDCIMPRVGVFARVLHGGEITRGDKMEIVESPGFRAAILTLSDKGSRGERQDASGPLIKSILEKEGYEVIETLLLPDDRTSLGLELKRLADERQVDLILTTGGTGFSERDITPEATLAVATRNAPGIAEAIRFHSLQITKRAMLSRAVSVIRNKTLIVNLPGSPKAVQEGLEYILPVLEHGLQILKGTAGDCADSNRS